MSDFQRGISLPVILFDLFPITKLSPCNEDPHTPHFYIVKLGFTGVYIFLIFAQKHRLWVLVRTASLKYHIFLSENYRFYRREILQYFTCACFHDAIILV